MTEAFHTTVTEQVELLLKKSPEAMAGAAAESEPEQEAEDGTKTEPAGAAEAPAEEERERSASEDAEIKTDSADEPEDRTEAAAEKGPRQNIEDAADQKSEDGARTEAAKAEQRRKSRSCSRSRSRKVVARRESEPPDKAEVDEFLKRNEVDERAAGDLRDCPPDLQRKVLDRGDLNSARNSSAALIVRIRDARMDAKDAIRGPRQNQGLPSTKELNEFIQEHNINEDGAAALRSASPTMKRNVLNSTEFANSGNISALLVSRIKGRGGGSAGGGGGGFGAADAVRQALRDMGASGHKDVEEFIKVHDVDVQAAAQLRECSREIQQAVISRGGFSSAHNPSSALISRIKEAQGIPEPPPQYGGYAPGYPMPYGYPPPGYPGYMGYPPGYPVYPGYAPPPGAYGYPSSGAYAYPPPGPSEAPGQAGSKNAKVRGRSGSYSYSSYSYTPSPSRSPSRSRRNRSPSRGRKRAKPTRGGGGRHQKKAKSRRGRSRDRRR